MADITNPKLLYTKGVLFLLAGVMAAALLILDNPTWQTAFLLAVAVTPGSPAQVGLVRRALGWFGRDLPVGAHNLDHPRDCVSAWHYEAFGGAPPSRDAEPAAEVLLRYCGPDTTLLTGGPLKNLGAAIRLDAGRGGGAFRLGRLVAQGGFAGEGVVPPERQLDKFKGLTTCPTYNLNGDPRAALAVLASAAIGVRRFVAKNVCHGVCYDRDMHAHFEALAGK